MTNRVFLRRGDAALRARVFRSCGANVNISYVNVGLNYQVVYTRLERTARCRAGCPLMDFVDLRIRLIRPRSPRAYHSGPIRAAAVHGSPFLMIPI